MIAAGVVVFIIIRRKKKLPVASVLLSFLLIIGLFAFTACSSCSGSSENLAAMAGRYVIVEITDDPDGVNYSDLDGMYKEQELDLKDYMYMEFSEDGEFTLVLFGEEEAKGTYTKKGKNVTITANGETINTVLDGQKITWTYETGAKLIFEKK